MGVLNLGLANLSVDSNFIQIIKGLVLLLAVAFDVRSKIAGRPSFIGFMISALTRSGDRTKAESAPVASGSTLITSDTNRSASPSGAPTLPEDLPHGLDDLGRPGSSGSSVDARK
jgi:putative multiple sugar transport system permease protein